MTDQPSAEAQAVSGMLTLAREARETVATNWGTISVGTPLSDDLLSMIEQAALNAIGRAVKAERERCLKFGDAGSAHTADYVLTCYPR